MDNPAVLFDAGNTALKIAWSVEHHLSDPIFIPTQDVCQEKLDTVLRTIAQKTDGTFRCFCACSVVPHLNSVLAAAVDRIFNAHLLFAPETLSVPLTVCYEPQASLGHDRLVEAFAARALCQEPALIVIDLGTAVTIDCVQETCFLGGFILPGPALAFSSLNAQTAQLPLLESQSLPSAFEPGRSTKSCIQNGVLFGLISLLEGMITRLKKTLAQPVHVVATGGFAAALSKTALFDTVSPHLVLTGLHLLSQHKNKR